MNGVLLDENLSNSTLHVLRDFLEPLPVWRVGLDAAPPLGTDDSDLLAWCVQQNAAIISLDRKTMIGFHSERVRRGEQAPPLISLPDPFTTGDLYMAAVTLLASETYELVDRVHFLR